MNSVMNVGSSAADSLSQLCAVVLGDSVCCGCRDVLELGIPKNTNKVFNQVDENATFKF